MFNQDLNAMSLKELRQLQKDVATAIETYEARQKEAARLELEELAKARGYSLSELAAIPVRRGRTSATLSAAKYRHPENPEQTWSGRGRRPAWVKAVLDAGGSLESLRIGA